MTDDLKAQQRELLLKHWNAQQKLSTLFRVFGKVAVTDRNNDDVKLNATAAIIDRRDTAQPVLRAKLECESQAFDGLDSLTIEMDGNGAFWVETPEAMENVGSATAAYNRVNDFINRLALDHRIDNLRPALNRAIDVENSRVAAQTKKARTPKPL